MGDNTRTAQSSFSSLPPVFFIGALPTPLLSLLNYLSAIMFFRPALLIAGAGLAVAQSISSQCSSALTSVATSSQAACLDLLLLAPLATSNTNTSIIPTVNNWLTGMCSQAPCTNATLQSIVTSVVSGCSSDLASLGLSTSDPTSLAMTVEAAYPAVRQIACLKDTSANTLCATEQLTEIQSSTTTLSINNIVGMATMAMTGKTMSIPQNVTCSNCSKAAYTILAKDFPTLLTNEQATFQSECGSSFTDGQMPSNIQEAASNSTSTGGAASLSVSSLNVGVAMLIAVSSAFVVFA
ncbi:hypothetical protein J3R82DRAFT_10326 [Butyriboletus roseoflavus]|nr:hypothetical protein J3R82DRAFT_10326 [Butyriboletus roseoflavus]